MEAETAGTNQKLIPYVSTIGIKGLHIHSSAMFVYRRTLPSSINLINVPANPERKSGGAPDVIDRRILSGAARPGSSRAEPGGGERNSFISAAGPGPGTSWERSAEIGPAIRCPYHRTRADKSDGRTGPDGTQDRQG